MRAAVLILGLVSLLTACREPPAEQAPLPNPLAEATLACERAGGEMMSAGLANTRVCVWTTRDSGKICRRGGDCEGECLARSGTCAPVRPLFGCHDILMDSGSRGTLCRD